MAAQASETPRIRVAALILEGERVVVVRHRRDDRTYHLLPGGGVEAGETLADALTREVAEETGLRVRLLRPLFLSDSIDPRGSRHVLNVTVVAEVVGGELTTSPSDPRVEAVELVDIGDLANMDLRPPIGTELVRAIEGGLTCETKYLGSLWADEAIQATP